MSDLGDFKSLIASLNASERKRVAELIASLRTPIEENILSCSDTCTGAFLDEFRSHLLMNHVLLESPMYQDTFDRAFIASMEAAGRRVTRAADGQRFWDVAVDGQRVSLKSTAEKNLAMDRLKISKLTEAAWIQDCRMAGQRRDHTVELFRRYNEMVHRIFQLRYFRKTGLYELVEIPVSLFDDIFAAGVDAFKSDGPSIGIPVGKDPPNFILKLDRSDAKITLNSIRKEACVVHGQWRVG
jgi:hypothetical protein